MMYRKVALIEAYQFIPGAFSAAPPEFREAVCIIPACGAPEERAAYDLTYYRTGPHVHTLEGNLVVSSGDWIAKGVKGEFWAIKPDVFAESYVAVDDDGC